MGIENSYMKYGHSFSSGVVRQQMKPETMKTWAYSLNGCCEMFVSLESLQNKEAADNELHKEEPKSRITHYKNDRDNIRSKWEISSDVFDFNHRPETGLINIGMGENYLWFYCKCRKEKNTGVWK